MGSECISVHAWAMSTSLMDVNTTLYNLTDNMQTSSSSALQSVNSTLSETIEKYKKENEMNNIHLNNTLYTTLDTSKQHTYSLVTSLNSSISNSLSELNTNIKNLNSTFIENSKKFEKSIENKIMKSEKNISIVIDGVLDTVAENVHTLTQSITNKGLLIDKSLQITTEKMNLATTEINGKMNAIDGRVIKLEAIGINSSEISNINREKIASLESSLNSIKEHSKEDRANIEINDKHISTHMKGIEAILTKVSTKTESNEDRSKHTEDVINTLRDRITKLETLVEMLMKDSYCTGKNDRDSRDRGAGKE